MKYIIIAIAWIITFTAGAQPSNRERTIGDGVPNGAFTNLLYYSKPQLRFSDFRNKVTLIEFTNPRCSGCIASLLRLKKLQQESPGLQVVLVTSVGKKEWEELSGRLTILKELTFPVILGDTALKAAFPHIYVPHLVWLDKRGIVRAITPGEYATAKNVELLAAGKQPAWPVKADRGHYDFSKPLLQFAGEGHKGNSVYYSAFMGHKEGTTNGIKWSEDSVNGTARFTAINIPVVNLFRLTMKDHPARSHYNRMVLEVRDRAKFFYDSTQGYHNAWKGENTYCYEAVMPRGTSKEAFGQKLRADLEGVLGYAGKEEVRKVKCYVLQKAGVLEVAGEGESSKSTIRSIAELVYILNGASGLPVIDETGSTEEVNIPNIVGGFHDSIRVKNLLARHGLKLVEEERELSMFVIREIKR